MGELLAVLGGMCFSVSTMMYQRGMKNATAAAGVTVNLLVNNLIFLIALVLTALRTFSFLNVQGILLAAAGGVAGSVFGRTLSFLSVQRIGSSRTTSLMLTQNMFAFILGVLIMGEVLRPLSLLGIVLVVAGVYWLSREKARDEEIVAVPDSNDHFLKKPLVQGIFLGIMAALAYSGGDLFRKLSLRMIPSAMVISMMGGLAGLLFQTTVITFRGRWKEITRLDPGTWRIMGLSGAASGFAVLTINSALKLAPVAIVSALYSTRIWFVIAMGPVLLKKEERITRSLLFSAALLVTGVLIIILC